MPGSPSFIRRRSAPDTVHGISQALYILPDLRSVQTAPPKRTVRRTLFRKCILAPFRTSVQRRVFIYSDFKKPDFRLQAQKKCFVIFVKKAHIFGL